MVADVAIRRGSARARGTRGNAFVLLTHLRGTAIVVGLAFTTATGKRRTEETRQTAAHRDVAEHLTLGVLTARAGMAQFFCKVRIEVNF